MARKLDKLTIRGFKSIEALDGFALGDLNVLIGANGAGKSNFVSFFRLLREMVDERLQKFARTNGPADGLFFNGVSHTKKIEVDLVFDQNRYKFNLVPTADNGLLIDQEATQYLGAGRLEVIGTGESESKLGSCKDRTGLHTSRSKHWYVHQALTDWHVYHFHDTSLTAGMRRDSGIEQTESLKQTGENLAAFLLSLRNNHPDNYELIRKTTQRIAPYFDDFVLSTRQYSTEDQVRLTWKQKGKDYIFSPGHFSDGTIRFICLATALLQPSPPSTIVVDEPELGLHPEALSVLGGLFRSAASRMQIIVATQSPVLLDEFDPKDVITVDQTHGASQFNRLDSEALEEWLNEYSLGEVWMKGTFAGAPKGSGGINHG